MPTPESKPVEVIVTISSDSLDRMDQISVELEQQSLTINAQLRFTGQMIGTLPSPEQLDKLRQIAGVQSVELSGTMRTY